MDLFVGGAEDCGLLEAEVPPEEEPLWDSRWCCCSAATRFLGPPMVKLGGLVVRWEVKLVLCRGSVRWISDSECVLAEAYWFDCVVVVVGGRAVLMLEGG
jgi:hypothetical protein